MKSAKAIGSVVGIVAIAAAVLLWNAAVVGSIAGSAWAQLCVLVRAFWPTAREQDVAMVYGAAAVACAILLLIALAWERRRRPR